MLYRALNPPGGGEYPHPSQSQSLHEIPTSPSRALGCFSSHSAQSTTSVSSTHSLQPLTPSVSPKWDRSLGGALGAVDDAGSSSTQALVRSGSGSGTAGGGGSTSAHDAAKHHQEKISDVLRLSQ